MSGCTDSPAPEAADNSIYYWRTSFRLNESERDFIRAHGITKLYIRFFDVDIESYEGSAVPVATVVFADSVPSAIGVVPTVFITTRAMERMAAHEGVFAQKIFKRIKAICRRNGIAFSEIQLDCDWTNGTREPFFRLCRELKACMGADRMLSSTVRLHQLAQSPPPVDKGVLMVYNTGNLMDMSSENSIFSVSDIEPYLRDHRLAHYAMPLDVAYPVFGWSVIYRPANGGYAFNRLLRRTDFSGCAGLTEISANTFEANQIVNLNFQGAAWDAIGPGWRIRVERPAVNEVLAVKSLIDRQLGTKSHTNILYHLDQSQYDHYSTNDINKIYRRN